MILYLLAISLSFLLSLILVPPAKKIALRLKIVDEPKEWRKIHHKPTPLLGGLVIFISVFLVMLFFRLSSWIDFSQVPDKFLYGVFLGGLVLMIGGYLDDRYNLKPHQQIIASIIAAIVVIIGGINITYVTNPVGSVSNAIIYLTPVIGIILTFFWLMVMMYTTKFLDGLDGLSGGIGAIAAMVIFFLSLNWDVAMSATGIWALALFGAILGFLVYNWHPAKIFLGEGGSLWIGFMLGVLSIISGSKIAATLLVIGIPALDVVVVIIKRVINRQSPFKGDRRHLHHQLLAWGLSHRGAVLFLYLIALIFGLLSIFFNSFGKMIALIALFIIMVFLVIATEKKEIIIVKIKNYLSELKNRESKEFIRTVRIMALIAVVVLVFCISWLVNLNARGVVFIGGQKIKVELAKTNEEKIQGLSHRRYLKNNHGMLFVYNGYFAPSFWMKDMKFAIDIIWIRDKIIIGLEKNLLPADENGLKIYRPNDFITHVLEVPAGYIDKNNLKIGDEVRMVYD